MFGRNPLVAHIAIESIFILSVLLPLLGLVVRFLAELVNDHSVGWVWVLVERVRRIGLVEKLMGKLSMQDMQLDID